MSIDVVLVTGHDARNPGARAYNGIPENYHARAWAPTFARAIRTHELADPYESSLTCRVVHRRDGLNLDDQYDDLLKRIRRLDPGCVLDLHHNAGGYPGSTAIASGAASYNLATMCGRALALAQHNKWLGVRDHTALDGRPRAWRGDEKQHTDGKWYPAGTVLRLLELDCPVAILEPFDGTDEEDYRKAITALVVGRAQAALAEAIAEFFA